MIAADTLLIVSLGELGTNVLEAVGRSGLFERIVVASRSADSVEVRQGAGRFRATNSDW